MSRYLWPVLAFLLASLLVWAVVAESKEDRQDAATLRDANDRIQALAKGKAAAEKERDDLKRENQQIKENLVVYRPGFYQPDWSLHLEDESK